MGGLVVFGHSMLLGKSGGCSASSYPPKASTATFYIFFSLISCPTYEVWRVHIQQRQWFSVYTMITADTVAVATGSLFPAYWFTSQPAYWSAATPANCQPVTTLSILRQHPDSLGDPRVRRVCVWGRVVGSQHGTIYIWAQGKWSRGCEGK